MKLFTDHRLTILAGFALAAMLIGAGIAKSGHIPDAFDLARWGHFLAGITWVGLLYFFNFVQAPALANVSPETKAELFKPCGMVRMALWWFRWAAMATLIFGGILLLILTLVRRRAETMGYAAQPFPGMQGMQGMQAPSRSFAGTADAPGRLPPSSDRESFLTSAKQIFVRMQTAWDAKDIADIRRFCTPEIASRIEADMTALGEGRALTEVAMLNAELADVWPESGYEWAAVSFDAMLREQSLDAAGALTEDIRHEVREYWIFRHDPRLEDSTWFLAGIQQAA